MAHIFSHFDPRHAYRGLDVLIGRISHLLKTSSYLGKRNQQKKHHMLKKVTKSAYHGDVLVLMAIKYSSEKTSSIGISSNSSSSFSILKGAKFSTPFLS